MSFTDLINTVYKALNNEFGAGNETYVEPCIEKLDHYTFYQAAVVPAVLIMLSFSFTKKRRRLLLDVFKGKPGLIFPMDILTRDTSMSYAAAFGATLYLVYIVVFEQKYAFVSNGPPEVKSLVVISSMIIYGVVFFPVFACLAIGSTFGYCVGSIYVWFFTGASIYQQFQCAHKIEIKTTLVLVARSIPQMACLFYLCCSLPGRFVMSIKKGRNFFMTLQDEYQTETLEEIKESYVGLHVIRLFKKPLPKPDPPEGKLMIIKSKVIDLWHRLVYQTDAAFNYSSRFLSVMLLGVCLIYMLTLELSVSVSLILDFGIKSMQDFRDVVVLGANNADTEEGEAAIEIIEFANRAMKSIKSCFIVSMFLTACLNLLVILHMMSSYRTNLRALHKGDYTHIPSRTRRTNPDLLVGSIRYAGYQVAYIAWGFIIQFTIIFLIGFSLTCLVIFLDSGFNDWILSVIKAVWPILLSAILISILQTQLAKFAFLQGRGKELAFENRRLLFSFTYFMYFYNIFLGLISCLLRIIKAIVIGALLLSRLDNSTLPERFQFFDPGFAAYVGFMHIENSHNHPVVLVLVRILMASRRTKLKSLVVSAGVNFCAVNDTQLQTRLADVDGARRRKAARFNWHVTYTLIHNPELRLYRKGYLQALKKAQEEGLTVPASDSLLPDPAIFLKKEHGGKYREKEIERPVNGHDNSVFV
ncbi:hypothetical protein SNE40_000922 [Patella caerulea]|uniref:Receptor for retinol uptake STRA6 n=1 Tax=Patella caerulea TaxID=87958 RepID=A0AAN8Q7L7_PATCE